MKTVIRWIWLGRGEYNVIIIGDSNFKRLPNLFNSYSKLKYWAYKKGYSLKQMSYEDQQFRLHY